MEQSPEFEAWVRNGELDAVRLCLVFRTGNVWVIVNVENRPNLVVGIKAIFGQLSFSRIVPLGVV
jgi:hypothetical protein